MDRRADTLKAIEKYAHTLNTGKLSPPLDPKKVLAAIAHNESEYGKNDEPRHESAYDHGGKYANAESLARYGRDAACSWGPWQIMFENAREFGYAGAPKDLADPDVSLPFVLKFINERIIAHEGAKTLKDIAAAYNSGSIHGNPVKGYVGNCLCAYGDQSTLNFLAGKFC